MAEKAIIGIFIMAVLLLSMGGTPTDDLDRQDIERGGINDGDFNRRNSSTHEGSAQGNFNEEQYDCRTEEMWSVEKQAWCDSHIGRRGSCYYEDWLFCDAIPSRKDTYCEPDYYEREPIYSSPQIIIIFIIVDGDNFSVFNIEEILDLWGHTSNHIIEYTCDDDPLTDDCYEEEPEIHPCNLPITTNCED